MNQLNRLSALLLAATLGLAGCDEEPIPEGELSGSVYLVGPIGGAKVDIENEAGDDLCTAFTDAAGHYTCRGRFEGLLTIEVSGEEVTYQRIFNDEAFDLRQIRYYQHGVVPDFVAGSHTTAIITPFTTLASGLAEARLAAGKEDSLAEAAITAYRLFGEHLGGAQPIDLAGVEPANVFAPIDPTTLDQPAVRYGLALAAFDYLNLDLVIVGDDDASPSRQSPDFLAAQLLEDISAGEPVFDGELDGEPVTSFTCADELLTDTCNDLCHLGGHTFRFDLARALDHFLANEHNLTGLTGEDVAAYAAELSAPGDAELMAAEPDCVPDFDAPVITTSQTVDGEDVLVRVDVSDPTTRAGAITFHFDEQEAASASDAVVATGGFTMRLGPDWYPGRYLITATDVVGNPAELYVDVAAPTSPAP